MLSVVDVGGREAFSGIPSTICVTSICDRVNGLAVAPPIVIASGSVMGVAVGANFHPINREPLRYVNMAVDGDDSEAVI
jgi:hypothetical protein